MVTKMGRYIVVGVDGSDSAPRAVWWAVDEDQAYEQDQLAGWSESYPQIAVRP